MKDQSDTQSTLDWRLPKSARILAILAIVGLWTSALFFPSLGTCQDGHVTWFENGTVVYFGWMAALTGLWGWYANLALIWALVRLARGRMPTVGMSVVALLMACTAFLDVSLAHSESHTEPLCARGSGFWLWFSSVLTMMALALAGSVIRKRAGLTSGR